MTIAMTLLAILAAVIVARRPSHQVQQVRVAKKSAPKR